MPETGTRIRVPAALSRFVGLLLCLIPLGAGFIPVLFDDRRRGLHDRLAGSVVRWPDADRLLTSSPSPIPVGRIRPGRASRSSLHGLVP